MSIENSVNFIGNLTADPEGRTVAGGTRVVDFKIAVNRRFKKGEEFVEKTAFPFLTLWGDQAVRFEEQASKGDKVAVRAEWEPQEYDDRNTGERKYLDNRFKALEFRMLKCKKWEAKANKPAAAPVVEEEDDSIPFD